jgi:hypothetical protein
VRNALLDINADTSAVDNPLAAVATPMGIRPARCSSLAVTGDFPGVAKTRFAYGAATSRAGGPLAPGRSRGRTCVCRAGATRPSDPRIATFLACPARACHQPFAIVQREAGDPLFFSTAMRPTKGRSIFRTSPKLRPSSKWPDPHGRQPWERSSEVRFGRIPACILDQFLLKSIDCRIQIPVFLNGVTRLDP